MITTIAIKSALESLVKSLEDCNLIKEGQVVRTVYDPTLTLIRTWSKNKKFTLQTKEPFDPLKVLEKITKKPDEWAILTWNRGSVEIDPNFGIKTYRFVTPVPNNDLLGNQYKAKMVQLPLTVKFYTNNGNLIERIEESLICDYALNTVFNIPVEHIGTMTVSMSPIENSDLNKLDTKTTGQLFEFQVDFILKFLLFADRSRELPLIKRAFLNVKVGTQISYEFDIGFMKDNETKKVTAYYEEPKPNYKQD